jgi:hypothetical protein
LFRRLRVSELAQATRLPLQCLTGCDESYLFEIGKKHDLCSDGFCSVAAAVPAANLRIGAGDTPAATVSPIYVIRGSSNVISP